MRLINEQFGATPDYGSRERARHLRRHCYNVGYRVHRLMRKIAIEAVYKKPHTSDLHPLHKTYLYLLGLLDSTRLNQV
ncbi:hypothetical protein [Nitrospira sp. M1]